MKYTDLTPEEKAFLCNGAGRRGWQGKIVPEFVFTESANQHDFDYWKGCSSTDRLNADRRFLENMLDAAEYKTDKEGRYYFNPKGDKIKRFILCRMFYRYFAAKYYTAVRELGGTRTLGGFNFSDKQKTHRNLVSEMKESRLASEI